jgi:hypothetical protein
MKISKLVIVIILVVLYGLFYKVSNHTSDIKGGGKEVKEIKKTYVSQNKLGYYDDNYPGYENGIDGINYGQVEATLDAPLWKFTFELALKAKRQISNEDTELFLETMKAG